MFQNLDFEWEKGEHWAVLSHSGADLTAFLDTLRGRTMVTEGVIERPFANDYQKIKTAAGEVNSFRDLIAVVSQKYTFRNKSNLQNFYYQQRFNSMESEETATVEEFLLDIPIKNTGYWTLQKVISLLHLNQLKDKSLIKLSNGETRRLAIAQALLQNPKLLLMDQPLTGLDVQTRAEFGDVLQQVVNSGTHIVMGTNPEEIPDCITDIAVLGKKKVLKILSAKEKDQVNLDFEEAKGFEDDLLKGLLLPYPLCGADSILRLENVNVRYGEKQILHEINWKVKAGERWSLKGSNGAGKSTLLSLILGENPQAYANEIYLFDRRRGTGESIWDIKKKIGFVAPELSRFFPGNQTCLKVVLSGLFDTMGLFRKVNPDQERLALDWLKLFGLEDTKSKLMKQVSLENQRFILLARAMIKKPDLLVLDEASQGMDMRQRRIFKETVNRICELTPVTLIYVSHYVEDIPEVVDREFGL
ncbi:putative molybdenum transport ATP-binding protein [Indibacter alkaliphilus LW1]|uniref:Molybdenum transport ATP-binding protein n=1 Tax=Indibacter alkaliphilus (strain CCUG 57479 / KCTC 22604 / LW1) TaxID=1189612 RepID=S2E4B5_INDAL|nr:ATP-binding cassette domain-containing protein [Indibacter alkaliphilus]EOZ97048.1 putative molybdenum transport ATP-binding protein [Indibacter alkaliphilus LW1]